MFATKLFISSKNYYHTRKRCRILTIPELQPSFDKSYLSLTIDVIMKPCCVSPGWNKHYNCSIIKHCFIMAFLDPLRQFPAIWWIAVNHMPPPILGKSIILNSIMLFTFCVFMCATWVKRKMKLSIKIIKQLLRRSPFRSLTRHHSTCNHSYFLKSNSSA